MFPDQEEVRTVLVAQTDATFTDNFVHRCRDGWLQEWDEEWKNVFPTEKRRYNYHPPTDEYWYRDEDTVHMCPSRGKRTFDVSFDDDDVSLFGSESLRVESTKDKDIFVWVDREDNDIVCISFVGGEKEITLVDYGWRVVGGDTYLIDDGRFLGVVDDTLITTNGDTLVYYGSEILEVDGVIHGYWEDKLVTSNNVGISYHDLAKRKSFNLIGDITTLYRADWLYESLLFRGKLFIFHDGTVYMYKLI